MPTTTAVNGMAHGTANGGAQPTKKILIAEDNTADARTLGRLLKESGFPCEIEYTDNLHKTLKRVEHDCPDVILLDLGLPPSFGTEALEAVRAVCPHLAVVVVTGSDDDELMIRTAHAGAHGYIRKDRLGVHRLLFQIYTALRWQEEAERQRDLAVYSEQIRSHLQRIDDTLARLQREHGGHEGRLSMMPDMEAGA